MPLGGTDAATDPALIAAARRMTGVASAKRQARATLSETNLALSSRWWYNRSSSLPHFVNLLAHLLVFCKADRLGTDIRRAVGQVIIADRKCATVPSSQSCEYVGIV